MHKTIHKGTTKLKDNKAMKAYTRQAIGSFQRLATKQVNGYAFTSWRTPDNKHFYLAPASEDLNVVRFGSNPEHYEISYTLLGHLDMIR